MKTTALVLGLLLSWTASAHLEVGTYQGVDQDRKACSFEVISIEFKEGLHHPLNEVVTIMTSDSLDYQLTHLPVFDLESKTVRPEKDFLRGTEAFPWGAVGVSLQMSHEPGQAGPVKLVWLADFWQEKKSNIKICDQLTFRKK